MSPDFVINVLKHALTTGAMVVAPIMLVGMSIGVLVGAFQAATQVSEPTLTFVPKVIAVGVVGSLLLPWGLGRFVHIFQYVVESTLQVTR
jgi:flagellar biosynthesis protein FliQ